MLSYSTIPKKSSFASLEALIHTAARAPVNDYTGFERKLLTDQVKEGCLAGLLRCLSPQQRIAFILHVLLGIPVQDIAVIIDKSKGATKVLVHRARQNLRDFLCANCSLYNPANPCHCEDLIDFSLKQGWIKKPDGNDYQGQQAVDTTVIAQEIEDIRKITLLYRDLAGNQPPGELQQRIQNIIKDKNHPIFQSPKV